jgi:glycosyltransferase involved in cell wall biosynthesis
MRRTGSLSSATERARPRILFLPQYLPWPPPLVGAQLRLQAILEQLMEIGDVAIAAAADAELFASWPATRSVSRAFVVQPDPPRPGGRNGDVLAVVRALVPSAVPYELWQRRPRTLHHCLRRLRDEGAIDVVWAARTWMAEVARGAGFRRIVVDVDDFEAPVWRDELTAGRFGRRTPLVQWMTRRLARYEAHLANRFAVVVTSRPTDVERFSADVRHRVLCVPNGTVLPDVTTSFTSYGRETLFVGALDYAPNIDAVRWLVEQVWPCLRDQGSDARLTVAGRGPADPEIKSLASSGALTLVESPLDLAPLYAAADLVVAPMRSGAGTKLKVMEAMAHGRPLVATTEAIVGIGGTPDVHLVVADDAKEFARAIIRLHGDAAARETLGTRAIGFARQYFGWSAGAPTVRRAIRAALHSEGTAQSTETQV